MASIAAFRSAAVSSPARPPMQIPSNGRDDTSAADSARSPGSRPPWTIPNSAWSVRPWAASDRSAQRFERRVASATTSSGDEGKTG